MAGDANGARKARLAAALKENLKRRKTQARCKAGADEALKARTLDVAPPAGPENGPDPSPKSAPKRN